MAHRVLDNVFLNHIMHCHTIYYLYLRGNSASLYVCLVIIVRGSACTQQAHKLKHQRTKFCKVTVGLKFSHDAIPAIYVILIMYTTTSSCCRASLVPILFFEIIHVATLQKLCVIIIGSYVIITNYINSYCFPTTEIMRYILFD